VVPFLLLAALLAVMSLSLLPRQISRGVVLGAVAGFSAHLLLLSGATRHDAPDEGAVSHLKSVWLAPPHEHVRFW
jgi:hypothetical protein